METGKSKVLIVVVTQQELSNVIKRGVQFSSSEETYSCKDGQFSILKEFKCEREEWMKKGEKINTYTGVICGKFGSKWKVTNMGNRKRKNLPLTKRT